MSTRGAGTIGPNAIIQTAAALRSHVGASRAESLLRDATGREPDHMPTAMVDEREVIRLVRALRRRLDPGLFEVVLRDAGARTAEYLLAHRIPRAAQWLMRVSPPPIALRLLLMGIMRHTWTFAGTASVTLVHGRPARLVIAHCPMCRGLATTAPACHFYAGTLTFLLSRLVVPRAEVVEVACEASGAAACEFSLRID